MSPPKKNEKSSRITYFQKRYNHTWISHHYRAIIFNMLFRRLLSGIGRSMFIIPTACDYGFYLPPDRYTADQIPWQNMEITHTVDIRGAHSVQIMEDTGDAKQRFATLQATVAL